METISPAVFMGEAIRLAEENVRSGRGGPFGCVIVKDGKIIARGINLVTTSNDPTSHAEIVAIRRACESLGSFVLTGCEVFASSEPCPMCMAALYWARPARVYYASSHADAAEAGFDDVSIRQQLLRPLRQRDLPMIRLMEAEGKQPFRLWKLSTRKKKY